MGRPARRAAGRSCKATDMRALAQSFDDIYRVNAAPEFTS
jgi:hypothetical protein